MMPNDGTGNLPYLLRDKSWRLAGITTEATRRSGRRRKSSACATIQQAG
jgi:hypothetical protein